MTRSAAAIRKHQLRIAIVLEVLSILWMIVEGGVGVVAGVVAHSLSLEAFGVDSFLELVSASFVLGWLWLSYAGAAPTSRNRVQKVAELVVGAGLLLLAAYVLIGSLHELISQSKPDSSTPGLIMSVAAAVLMPVLFMLKRRSAAQLDSEAMRGDAYASLACGWMAWTLLAGLFLRHFLGWWWADPVAALILVVFLVREGREVLQSGLCATRGRTSLLT